MRAHAEAFLSDVEARPDSPEAGVAAPRGRNHALVRRRVPPKRGSIWNTRWPCSNPGATTIWPFASDTDVGVAAMLFLAFVLWPLGDIGRAVSLVGDAEARIAGLAHVGTRAYGKMHAALFELMRGDFSRAASNGVELVRLAREHELPLVASVGVVLRGLGEG